MKRKKIKSKKINKKTYHKNILVKCIDVLIILMIIYNIAYLVHKSITKKDYLEFLGISLLTVDNNLMKDDFNKNDLIIVEKIKEDDLKENDIIAYEINGKTRINKIFNIHKNKKNAEKYYITKSNLTINPDIEPVYEYQIIGKKTHKICGLGMIIKILQSKIFSIVSIIFIILLFIYNKYVYVKLQERIKKKIK